MRILEIKIILIFFVSISSSTFKNVNLGIQAKLLFALI